MTRERTHKLLYIPAFFALMLLISIITCIPVIAALANLLDSPLANTSAILSIIYIMILIIMPFIKYNKFLFLVPIDAYFNLRENSLEVYQYFFSKDVVIAKVGFFSPLWNPLMITLLDISGLVLLALRLYGYWQEHLSGKRTKF